MQVCSLKSPKHENRLEGNHAREAAVNMLNKQSRRADIVCLGVGHSSNKRQETNILRHMNFVIYMAYIALLVRLGYAKYTPGFWRQRMHAELW
jgi:hypothetical protein